MQFFCESSVMSLFKLFQKAAQITFQFQFFLQHLMHIHSLVNGIKSLCFFVLNLAKCKIQHKETNTCEFLHQV